MNIGAAIKKLRLEKRLTQEELAERANTSKPNISNLERNAQGFSPVILTSLAKALGVKVSVLFQLAEQIGEEDEKSRTDAALSAESVENLDEFIACYEKLTPRKRRALLGFLRAWTDEEE